MLILKMILNEKSKNYNYYLIFPKGEHKFAFIIDRKLKNDKII
jgi:hypothetical protein